MSLFPALFLFRVFYRPSGFYSNESEVFPFVKKYASLIISPLAVLLLMGIVFFCYSLFPFAENTLSWCDMSQQVLPILLEFKDILAGHGNLFLNMENAGGMNFWGVFLFFISSPFSFLVAFVPKEDMMVFMNILVVLKMMVCALTACIFFRRRFPNLGEGPTALLGVMYAFCGYTMMFYQNLVWLDMMYLFPLLLLGTERMLTERKPLLYCLTLCAVVTVNFYLSYMVVLFLVLAVALYIALCIPRDQRRGSIALFAVSSLVSALATAVVWLPALRQYLSSARGDDLLQSLSSGDFITKLFTMVPLLFCTAVIFACLPFLALRSHRNSRKITFCILMFVLMLIPIFIEPINKMWHTGSYQAFPVRYGYITIFLGLILTAVVLNHAEPDPLRRSSRSAIAVVACDLVVFTGVLLFLLFNYQTQMSHYSRSLWGDKDSFTYLLIAFLAAFVCYFAVVYLYKFRKIGRTLFLVALCVLVAIECVFNASVYIGTTSHSVSSYQDLVDLAGRLPQDSFYRVKADKKYFDVNMMGGLGYHSLSHYTSLNSQSYLYAMKKLGYSSYWMEVNSNNGTLLTDALLSNQYTIAAWNKVSPMATSVYNNGTYSILKNDLFLPLGLKIKGNLDEMEYLPDGERVDIQEYLYKTLLGGEGDLCTRYEPTGKHNITLGHSSRYVLRRGSLPEESSLTYHISVKGKQALYLDCFDALTNRLKEPINDSFQVIVNGAVVEKSYPNQRTNGLLELGIFEDEEVDITLFLTRNISAKSFGVFGMDIEKLSEAVEQAQGVEVTVDGITLTASCEAEQGEALALFVPYDTGFTAMVNGQAADIQRLDDTFMAVSLQEGENAIVLHYTPSGFSVGLILSVVGLLLLIGLCIWYSRGGRLPRWTEKLCFVPFYIFAYLVFAFLYLFPVAVYFFY